MHNLPHVILKFTMTFGILRVKYVCRFQTAVAQPPKLSGLSAQCRKRYGPPLQSSPPSYHFSTSSAISPSADALDMAEDTASSEAAQVTIHVKSSSDAKFTLTLPRSMTVLELKEKLGGSDYADIPADRQRLIYSGRVLKDPETLDSYKVQDGHTIHLVKSAASNQRQNPANAAASAPTSGGASGVPNVPSNIAAGPGNNPLVGLTGARFAGHAQLPGASMFGPDGGVSQGTSLSRPFANSA